MPTTGPVNGTLISIYKDVSGTLKKIANATSNSLDISKDMIDVTSKDSAGAKEFIAGEYGYTLNVEAIFEDPYEPSTVGCEVAGADDSCCASYLDIDFPVPNGLLDSIVVLTAEEISTFWQYGVNDMANDGIQTQPAPPSRRSRQTTNE